MAEDIPIRFVGDSSGAVNAANQAIDAIGRVGNVAKSAQGALGGISTESAKLGQALGTGAKGAEPPGKKKPEGRFTGGPVEAGKPYIVGEKSLELFIPRESGMILNRDQARNNLNLLSQVANMPIPVSPAVMAGGDEIGANGIAALISETRAARVETAALRRAVESRDSNIQVPVTFEGNKEVNFDRFLRLQRAAQRARL